AAPELSAPATAEAVAVIATDALEPTAETAPAPFSAAAWAASLPAAAAATNSAPAADSTPDTAFPLPVGDSPVAPSASGSASSSGGPAGAGLVATLAGTETAAPLSGSLFSRAGDDRVPSS